MPIKKIRHILLTGVFGFFPLFMTADVSGQETSCFTPDEEKKVIESMNPSGTVSENKKLRRQLLEMQEARVKMDKKILENPDKRPQMIEELNRLSAGQMQNLCRIYNEKGWLKKEEIGIDGLEAALFLIRNSRSFKTQREFFPVLVAAAEKGLIVKANIAALADNIRVKAGFPQYFGTQVKIEGDTGYLYPLENEKKVDDWRKQYGLPPLSAFIKEIEINYRVFVFKTPRPPKLKQNPDASAAEETGESDALPGLETAENEILKIDTRLVNLNVRLLTKDLVPAGNLQLQKDDFQIFEDGQEQPIAFFSTTEAPFDLILLLDLSGSTSEKRSVIEKSARRFIEAARPADRIAIVTFTHETEIVAGLTNDKNLLLEKVKDIEGDGGSKVWDALEYTYQNILQTSDKTRRSAIVLMTDAVDNTFSQYNPTILSPNAESAPSKTTFTGLLETVRGGDTTIFSIYLDTRDSSDALTKKVYRQAQRSMEMLAEETGGEYYYAKKINDLTGIYEQIINDLSRVYSLGYEPTNDTRDGLWRKITVRVKSHPELVVRTRKGYYAK